MPSRNASRKSSIISCRPTNTGGIFPAVGLNGLPSILPPYAMRDLMTRVHSRQQKH